jgi:hypothetical protein
MVVVFYGTEQWELPSSLAVFAAMQLIFNPFGSVI